MTDTAWDSFVAQNAPQNPPDPKWDDWVHSHFDPQQLSSGTVDQVVKTLQPAVAPQDEDLKSLHNSKDYQQGASAWQSLVNNAVIYPAIKAFSAYSAGVFKPYAEQAQMAEHALGEALQPIPEGQDPISGLAEKAIAIPSAAFSFLSSPVSGAAQAASAPLFAATAKNPAIAAADAREFGANVGMIPAFALDAFKTPGHPLNTVVQAKADGLFDGEGAYFGTKELSPEQRASIDEAKAAVQAVPAEPSPANTPAFDIHAAARNVAPEVFQQYDRLQAHQEVLRGQLNDLSEQKTADLDAQIKAIQDARQGGYGKLQSLIAKRDDLAAQDTPEMAEVRKKIQENDYAMRDLSPQVSAAYRTAAEFAPEEVPHETSAETPVEELAVKPEETPETPKLDIAADVSKNLVAAGRPEEEANAAAQLVAEHYKAVAEQGWTKGTPEEIYQRDMANIKAGQSKVKARELAQFETQDDEAYAQKLGRLSNLEAEISNTSDPDKLTDLQREKGLIEKQLDQNPKELNQSARGAISVATDDAKNTIKLMQTANASTFIHETGHHWLDEMMRYAAAEDAPEGLKKDAKTVRDWLGVDDRADFRARTANGRLVLSKQHEKFARGFERYLMEGVAPSKQLAGVFAKFKQWLTAIYNTVEKLRSPITNDIRDVFDRLLSANPQKTVIAPEHEPGKMLADIHEADAEHTPPEHAAVVRDNIETEQDQLAKHDKEITDALKSADKAGPVAKTPDSIKPTGGAAAGAGESAAAQPAEVIAGGGETRGKGSAARAGPYESVPRKPLSLSEWVKKNGGLKDEGGDVLSSLGGKIDRKLIRPKAGRSIDEMALRAEEAGYFAEKGGDRPSVEEFLAKLHEDINGEAQYSAHDTNAVLDYHDAIARNAEIDRITHDLGIDTKGKTANEVWDAIAEQMSVEKQAREAAEMASEAEDAIAKAEREEREWMESRGDAWEPEKETSSPRTLEDLENERQQENLARESAKSDAGPGASGPATTDQGFVQEGAGQVRGSIEPAGRTSEKAGGAANGTSAGTASRDTAGSNGAGRAGKPEAGEQTVSGESKPYYVDKKGVINFDLFKTPEDFQRFLQEWADNHPDKISQARGGVVSLDRTVELSKATGLTVDELLNRKVGELYDGPKQLAAAQFFIQMSQKLKEEADAAQASGDPQKLLDFAASLEDRHDFMNMFLQQVGLSAEASRALGARRAIRKLSGFDEAMSMGELFQRVAGTNMKDAQKVADLFASLDDPVKVSKFANKTREANFFDYMIAYRNNNLLSGPVTHLHYADGNVINLLYKPLKTAVASAVPGGPKLGEAGAMLSSMTLGATKGWQAAKAAWQDGIDRSFQETIENYKRPTKVLFNPTFDKYLGQNSPVGKSIRSIHSFFYTMNYEQEAARYAFRQALQEGLEENSTAFNNRVSDLITNQPKEMMAQVDAAAKKSVYMENPEYGTTMYHINQFANRTAAGRFLFPFAKMELNVKKQALLDNTVLGVFSKDVRANLAGVNGPEARAIQIAGIGLGTSLAGLSWAASDYINGNGPSDPHKRNEWLLTHTPNSIQIGNISIPLRALGNVGQILMAGSEIREAFEDMSHDESDKTAKILSEHVSRMAFEGTFIQSASDVTSALFHFDEYGARFLQNTAEGYVPYATMLAQANRYIDPFQRDVHSEGMANLYGITDAVKARVPFASEALSERVDVLGNPIPSDHYLASGSYEKYASDPVVQKLTSIGAAIPKPKRDVMGVPLTNQQYHDYAVTGGMLVKQNLSWILQTPGFDEMPRAAQWKEVSNAIGEARKAAANELMLNYPDIMQKARERKFPQ